MLANLSPLPNQCLKRKDVWMLSELPAQLEGAMLLNQGAPHPYPTSCESLACFVSLCFSLKEGLTEAAIKTRWDSVSIFHMRCHDGWSSFIPWLTAAWLVILPKVYYASQWELEAWEVSEGHCAFLGKALHLGPIQMSIHMSIMCSRELQGVWRACHWISAGCTMVTSPSTLVQAMDANHVFFCLRST